MIYFSNILKCKEKLKICWLRIMSYCEAHLGNKCLLVLFIYITFIAHDYGSINFAEQKLKPVSNVQFPYLIWREKQRLHVEDFQDLCQFCISLSCVPKLWKALMNVSKKQIVRQLRASSLSYLQIVGDTFLVLVACSLSAEWEAGDSPSISIFNRTWFFTVGPLVKCGGSTTN